MSGKLPIANQLHDTAEAHLESPGVSDGDTGCYRTPVSPTVDDEPHGWDEAAEIEHDPAPIDEQIRNA